MNPSIVDDACRALMGAVKRWHDQAGPTLTAGGSASAMTLTYTNGPTAYVKGDVYSFIAGSANTGATTLNVNGVGAIPILQNGTALIGAEINTGLPITVVFDGTNFQITSLSSVITNPTTYNGNVTLNGGTLFLSQADPQFTLAMQAGANPTLNMGSGVYIQYSAVAQTLSAEVSNLLLWKGDVNGLMTIGNALAVLGNTTMTGSLTVNNNIAATGNINVTGGLTISGATVFNNTVTSHSGLNVTNGATTLSGGANISAGLTVASGGATIHQGLNIADGLLTAAGGANITNLVVVGTGGIVIEASGPAIHLIDTNNSNIWDIVHNNTNDILTFNFNSITRYNYDTAGNLTIGGTLTQNSDQRVKQDIVTLESTIDRLMDMRAVRFKYKETPDKPQIGVIAQEVKHLFPELVSTKEDGSMSVAYGNMVAVLLRGIQDLKEEIATLKNRITILEGVTL